MAKFRQNQTAKIRAIIIGLFFCFLIGGFFLPQTSSKNVEEVTETFENSATESTISQKIFTQFPHSRHNKLSCNSCHKFPSANWKRVRKPREAFPDVTDYPKHESCLNCHRQQFFGVSSPNICSICHTNPSPSNSSRFPFPNPREIFDRSANGRNSVSDFEISFPHNKHVDIVSKLENPAVEFTNASFNLESKSRNEKSCVVCHQTLKPQGKSDIEFLTKPPPTLGDRFWLKKGTFKSVPISHANCFTCHSQKMGILPAPSNCAVCHKPVSKMPKSDFDPKTAAAIGNLDKITLLAWRKRDSSATFRHEFSSHAEMDCANCHNVETMRTTNNLSKKVAVTSCNLCHITEKTDDGGILNYEVDARKKDAKFQCVKCHLAFGKMPIPQSHLKAIAESGK